LFLTMSNTLKVSDWVLAVVMAAAGGLVGSAIWLAGGAAGFAAGMAGFVWLAALVMLTMLLYRRILGQLSKQTRDLQKLIGNEVENLYRQNEALINLRAELDVEIALPPMRGWAISPDFAVLLVDKLKQSSAESILECGAGVSSLITGLVLRKQRRGRLLSLEHDADYARQWQQTIHAYGLADYVTVIHAPLVWYEIDEEQWEWYDVSAVEENTMFDFLIVDGPPYVEGKTTRYPILRVLEGRIVNGATLLLDDAYRSAERKCVSLWLKETAGLEPELIPTEKGAAIISL
jgi:predicted O-methyltransferase YrrM